MTTSDEVTLNWRFVVESPSGRKYTSVIVVKAKGHKEAMQYYSAEGNCVKSDSYNIMPFVNGMAFVEQPVYKVNHSGMRFIRVK